MHPDDMYDVASWSDTSDNDYNDGQDALDGRIAATEHPATPVDYNVTQTGHQTQSRDDVSYTQTNISPSTLEAPNEIGTDNPVVVDERHTCPTCKGSGISSTLSNDHAAGNQGQVWTSDFNAPPGFAPHQENFDDTNKPIGQQNDQNGFLGAQPQVSSNAEPVDVVGRQNHNDHHHLGTRAPSPHNEETRRNGSAKRKSPHDEYIQSSQGHKRVSIFYVSLNEGNFQNTHFSFGPEAS